MFAYGSFSPLFQVKRLTSPTATGTGLVTGDMSRYVLMETHVPTKCYYVWQFRAEIKFIPSCIRLKHCISEVPVRVRFLSNV